MPVQEFVQGVRKQLNRILFWQIFIACFGIVAGLTVAVGSVYLLQGLAVPALVYPVAAISTIVLATVVWLVRRKSELDAAMFADVFFGLKDATTTCQNFAKQGLDGGFFDLQSKQAAEFVSRLQPRAIPFIVPRRTLAVGLLLGTTAAAMAFKSPSPEVLERLALEQAVLQETADLNQQLEQLIEETQAALDQEERQLLSPNELRQLVDELKETKNQKEALRQYAKFEQKMKAISFRLQQRRDEEFLDRAAKELKKTADTQKLAERLARKKYDQAGQELGKLKPQEKKSLTQQQKELAKLRSTTRRMMSASQPTRNTQKTSSTKSSNNASASATSSQNAAASSNNSSSPNSNGSDEGSSSESSPSVEDLVQALDDSANEWDQQLSKAIAQEKTLAKDNEATKGECQACARQTEEQLDRLMKQLSKLGTQRKLQSKLDKLCKACSAGQSACAGLCQSPNPGGKEAGMGISESTRSEQDALVDNGQHTRLKGQKGAGPSLVSVESADEGSGVSSIQHTAVQRSFERQVESFVEREDVPDDVKRGVRTYFEQIHRAEVDGEPQTTTPSDSS